MERKTIYVLAGALVIILVVAIWAAYYVTRPAAKQEIVIGASVCLTGWASREGLSFKHVFELWAEDVNARGGILGLPVRLILYDDESSTDVAMSNYERLITVDNVNFIIGPYGSTLSWATAPIAEKYHTPMITLYAVDTKIYTRGYNYVFGITELDSWESFNYIDYLTTLEPKPKTIAVLYLSAAFPEAVARYLGMHAPMNGFDVVSVESFEWGTTDLTPALLKFKGLNADVLISVVYIDQAFLVTRQMKEVNYAPRVYYSLVGPGFPEFMQELGGDADYVIEAGTWYYNLPESVCPGITEFVNKLRSKFTLFTVDDAIGYGACQSLEAAIKKAGSVDREAVRDALANQDISTVFGGVNFTSFVDPISGVYVTNVNIHAQKMYFIQSQHEEMELIYPPEIATTTVIYPFPPWTER